MFTKQAGRIEQSLIEGGLNPLSANDTMNAVGNCAQPLAHRGPVSIDYTPPDYRFVTPTLRKFRFPGLEPVQKEGRKKPRKEEQPKKRRNEPEEEEPKQPRKPFRPTRPDGSWSEVTSILPGPYINVGVAGPTTAVVGLNAAGFPGSIAVFGRNNLLGKSLQIRSANPNALRVLNANNSLFYTLQPVGEEAEVITGIKIDDQHMVLKKKKCLLLAAKDAADEEIELKKIVYLTNAEMGVGSLDFQQRETYVLAGYDQNGTIVQIPLTDCADVTAPTP